MKNSPPESIVVIQRSDPEFPLLLKQIPDPPIQLFRKGAPLDSQKLHVAMVGTRRSSTYGEKTAHQLAENISKQGGVVVSGLAFGIDAVAHRAAVNQQKPTVAILASALDNITPRSHQNLAEKILATGGTLLSEYEHDLDFHAGRYHQRNRLISGLCKATLVIEAPFKSGALITARTALEQNRDVFALPGDITRPQAQGCLKLISDGAMPIISIDDTLEKLGFVREGQQLRMEFSDDENLLIAELLKNPCSPEMLCEKLFLTLPNLQTLLSTLELKGAIQKNKGFLWEVA